MLVESMNAAVVSADDLRTVSDRKLIIKQLSDNLVSFLKGNFLWSTDEVRATSCPLL